MIFLRGFVPADESLLFRQKGSKPFLPALVPPGAWSTTPNKMAQELAALRQPSPRGRFGATAQLRPTQGI